MNNEEAKFLLQAYRPNGADASDVAFVGALEQVQRDPSLRDWFAREQAFDTAVSGKFNEVAAPAGLREAILAGGRVSTAGRTQSAWWRSPMLLAAAASVAVIFAVTLALWPKGAAAGTGLSEFVLADSTNDSAHMGFHGTDALQAMLGDSANRLSRGLPVDFEALRKAGCRTVTFQGREVLEVCFNRDGIWFHAYIGRRADFPAIASAPTFLEKNGQNVALWGDAAHIYLVASKAGRSALERLL